MMAVIGAVFAGLVVLAPAAQAVEWRSPVQLQLGDPVVYINRSFRMDDFGQPADGPVLPGQIVSFGSVVGLRDLGPSLETGTWVMFDLERWPHTTDWEQTHPLRAMRRFVREAHRMGFRAILAPSGHFRDRAMGLRADAFHAQVQHQHDPANYRAKVCAITRAFDGPVIAQLTANLSHPGHSVEELMRQYRAGLTCTDRFAMWGGIETEPLAVAHDFMARVA